VELPFHFSIFGEPIRLLEEWMEQVFRQTPQTDLVEPSVPGVSWAAVLAVQLRLSP